MIDGERSLLVGRGTQSIDCKTKAVKMVTKKKAIVNV